MTTVGVDPTKVVASPLCYLNAPGTTEVTVAGFAIIYFLLKVFNYKLHGCSITRE
jgi:hypothetical protein